VIVATYRRVVTVVFRHLRSSVVSTHSTGRFGVGQGQTVLAQGIWDRL